MTEKSKKVLQGFIELSDIEKKELVEFFSKYERADYLQKSRLFSNLSMNESSKRNVGVTSSDSCPCCGK